MIDPKNIAVLGGTGKEGTGLALRWAKAGHHIIIGSRDPARARETAALMNERLGILTVSGDGNEAAATAAEVVVLTVPFAAQRSTLEAVRASLNGKILVDATVPLVPPKVARVQLPPGGSAVAAIQEVLGADVSVVAAFQNVSADHLSDLDHEVDCDVLVCGDSVKAREVVVGLAADIGLTGVHAGPIANAAAVEALTSVLIAINMRYKASGSGIRITGIPRAGGGTRGN